MLSFLDVVRALLKVGPSPALEPSSEPVVTVSWVDVTCRVKRGKTEHNSRFHF